MALTVGCYGGWLAITYGYQTLPLAVTLVLGSLLITLHSSLQHEILHGHPTRSRRVNKWLGMVPLSLWIPFERYKQTHLLHHIDERLTDPLDDPEFITGPRRTGIASARSAARWCGRRLPCSAAC